MTRDELNEVLRLHSAWLLREPGGVCAYLYGKDLRGADLRGAELIDADLSRANLSGATLARAKLSSADFTDSCLAGANLSYADLTGADLARAYLVGTDLTYADLSYADLTGATVSSGVILKESAAYMTCGPVGHDGDTLEAYRTSAGLWVRTGRSFGSEKDLRSFLRWSFVLDKYEQEYRDALSRMKAAY